MESETSELAPISRGLTFALASAAILGAASALGDWLWAAYLTDGAILPAIGHGLAIFALLAVLLSWEADGCRSLKRHLAALPALGLFLAGTFYPIAGVVGYLPALLISWTAMWLGLAFVQRWNRVRSPDSHPERPSQAFARGLLAAVLSGLGFWAISGIWTNPGPSPKDFGPLQHLGRAATWGVAFLPGFLALMAGQRAKGESL